MCGIAGFAGYGSEEILRSMTDALIHRGPDAAGFYRDTAFPVFLGHRRLSIIDLSGGAQPMISDDNNYIIVFNGEIYNHQELRLELELSGYKFSTSHSDTEVVLNGFRAWGEGLCEKMSGMWAFAIWDKQKKELFLSRDRFGKKPLFYTLQNNVFAFASELSALQKHPDLNFSLSSRSMKKYFAYAYIPGPNTIFNEAKKLPGGMMMRYSLASHAVSLKRYYEFMLEPDESKSEKSWCSEIVDALSRSVKRRLMSDVPLGVFLSGGIDSSAIAYFASLHAGSERLKTFTIGFEEQAFDESRYAAEMANLLKTEHVMERLSLDKAVSTIPEIMSRLDEPMGDASLIPTFLLCRHARKSVTVALGGDGGDELFAGYAPFKALNMARLYKKMTFPKLHSAIELLASSLPVSHTYMSLDFKIKKALSALRYPDKLWAGVWMSTMGMPEMTDLFNEPTDIEDVFSEAIEAYDRCREKNLVDKTLSFFTKLYLTDDILVKGDRASMMVSLEVRSPFLDVEMADIARKIPHSLKYRNGETKYILKKALAPFLPRHVLYRKKQGFGVPVGKWFKEGSLMITQDEMKSVPLNRAIMESKQNEHVEGRRDNRLFLWNLKVLGMFLKKHGAS